MNTCKNAFNPFWLTVVYKMAVESSRLFYHDASAFILILSQPFEWKSLDSVCVCICARTVHSFSRAIHLFADCIGPMDIMTVVLFSVLCSVVYHFSLYPLIYSCVALLQLTLLCQKYYHKIVWNVSLLSFPFLLFLRKYTQFHQHFFQFRKDFFWHWKYCSFINGNE